MAETFHLGLDTAMLSGSTWAIVPGDPERVEKIAAFLDEPQFLASHREFTSWVVRRSESTAVEVAVAAARLLIA